MPEHGIEYWKQRAKRAEQSYADLAGPWLHDSPDVCETWYDGCNCWNTVQGQKEAYAKLEAERNSAIDETHRWKEAERAAEKRAKDAEAKLRGVTIYECKHCEPKACPHVLDAWERLDKMTERAEGGEAERDRYKAALEEGEALDMLTDPSVSHTALLAAVNRFILIAREALQGEGVCCNGGPITDECGGCKQ